ncbi:hypothetical protein ELB75_02720 [Eikenella corrodens]|uniref:Uncharacterized protein n=1 Tax=Eikenella corrodens TaxID=539 RepID=A0A3S9SHN2_EIKCO|nr:hypothetical protein ELB75_02720 [Eikenella corrodens]
MKQHNCIIKLKAGFYVLLHRIQLLIYRKLSTEVDLYSELNLNQYSVGSPCRNVCTVCGSPPCPDFC